MKQKRKSNTSLSIAILTNNEAGNLRQLLPTLAWANEVIIIDDNSTDETVRVAKEYGAKVWRRKLNRNYAAQRNFGLERAGGKWVLWVDADERVSKALRQEIERLLSRKPAFLAYALPRRDVFMGRQLKYGETGQMELVRLVQKGKGKFVRPVHEVFSVKKVGRLSQPLIHYPHPTVVDFVREVKRYAGIEAEYRLKEKRPLKWWEGLVYPGLKWAYTYLFLQGFRDGVPGMVMSLVMAYHSWLVRYYQVIAKVRGWGKDWGERWLVLGLGLLIWVVPLGQLTRIEVNRVGAVYGFELLMGLVVGGRLIWLWWRRERLLRMSGVVWLGLWWLVLGGSLLVNLSWLGWVAVWASGYWWRLGLYGSFAWVMDDWLKNGLTVDWLDQSWWWWTKIWASSGLLQYFLMPDMRWLRVYGWDDHYFRLVGTLLDPGFMGLMLALGLMTRWISGRREKGEAGWRGAVLLALLLTYARSAYLVFGLGGLYWGIRAKKRLAGLGLALGVMVLPWFLPRPGGEGVKLERVYSVESRAESVVTAWEWFLKKPWYGMGFNAYKWVLALDGDDGLRVHPSGPDNSYMLILVTSGVIGLGTFMVLSGGIWLSVRANLVVSTNMLMVGIHALTNNSLFYVWVMLWLTLLVLGQKQINLKGEKNS